MEEHESVEDDERHGVTISHTPILDPSHHRFPFCIVWTPIPFITWILPFIGHMGICTSSGVIFDFAGPFFVSVDDFAFGRPTKYWRLDCMHVKRVPPGKTRREAWDAALATSSSIFRQRMYNFFCQNCHCFVAHCLNEMHYQGRNNWSPMELAFRMAFLNGHFVGVQGWIKTLLGFVLITIGVVVLVLYA